MSTTYSGKMMVGVHYDDLPEELKELDDIYKFTEDNDMDTAFEWQDCGYEGLIIGADIPNTKQEDFEKFIEYVNEQYTRINTILGVESKLLGTADIY
jgi:hypothetical protein